MSETRSLSRPTSLDPKSVLAEYARQAEDQSRPIIYGAVCVDGPDTYKCEQAIGVNQDLDIEFHVVDASATVDGLWLERITAPGQDPPRRSKISMMCMNRIHLMSRQTALRPAITYTLSSTGLVSVQRTRLSGVRKVHPLADKAAIDERLPVALAGISVFDPRRPIIDARGAEWVIASTVSTRLKTIADQRSLPYLLDHEGVLNVHRPMRNIYDLANSQTVTGTLLDWGDRPTA